MVFNSKFFVIKLLFAIFESKREVSGDAAFSNQRLLIANFFVAEKVLQDLVLQPTHVQPGILFASKTYGYCCERAGNE